MSSSGTSSPPPAAPEAASSPGPPPQAPPSPAGQPAGEGVTPPAGALTEVRLVGGGRVATRLAPHNTPTASPLLPRDDGYCSSDSTPKAAGNAGTLPGTLPHPARCSSASTPKAVGNTATLTLALTMATVSRPLPSAGNGAPPPPWPRHPGPPSLSRGLDTLALTLGLALWHPDTLTHTLTLPSSLFPLPATLTLAQLSR